MMKFALFQKFKRWSLPTKIGTLSALLAFISFILFTPFFQDDFSIYKFAINWLFDSGCKITIIDQSTKDYRKYDPDYAVRKIITSGHKDIPGNTQLNLKQGEICGTVNTEVQLPGQKRPYNLGDLDIENYKIVLPVPLVFIANTSKDNVLVDQIAERLLHEDAILTWIDRKDLIPGVEWKKEVKEAIEKAEKFLYFFSGFDNKEDSLLYISLKSFMNYTKLSEQIIPILINEIPIPTDFKNIVWLKMWEKGSYEKLVQTIKSQEQ